MFHYFFCIVEVLRSEDFWLAELKSRFNMNINVYVVKSKYCRFKVGFNLIKLF